MAAHWLAAGSPNDKRSRTIKARERAHRNEERRVPQLYAKSLRMCVYVFVEPGGLWVAVLIRGGSEY